ncbi:MAG: hypothetical protein FJ125_04765, partial [Deltaproteobacteria bacterium]|nr:hypothetical protein [Deltaproteobacteria bacterium]
MVRPADADFMARSGRSTLLLLLVLALLLLPSQAWGLSVEEQQLREAEAQRAAGRSELPRLGFGLDAVLDTAEGINRDRPSSSSTLIVTPQLKVGSTVRVKAELWLQVNHLAREDNPWDVPYTSLALSDLSLYREPKSGINLSGALAYYLPFSIDERNRDSYGNLRANLGL